MCRQYPPFYEQEINGVCVKKPPVVEPDTPIDYLAAAIIPIGIIVLVYYVMSKK
jgi:hypothetical protein